MLKITNLLNRSLDKKQRPKRSLKKILETKVGEKIKAKVESDDWEDTFYDVKNDEKDFIQKLLHFGNMFLDKTS